MSVTTQAPPTARTPTTVHVEVGGRRIALSFDVVRGVHRGARWVEVPGTPPWCLGLVQLHGGLRSLVDAGLLFFDEPARGGYQLELKGLPVEVALLVDQVVGVFPDAGEADLALDLAGLSVDPAFQPGAAGASPATLEG